MNISEPVTQLLLFYTKAENEKRYWTVRWHKRKEIFEGLRFIEYGKVELRTSGPFTTRAGAEGFVKNVIDHIPAFNGWFEIIEYK